MQGLLIISDSRIPCQPVFFLLLFYFPSVVGNKIRDHFSQRQTKIIKLQYDNNFILHGTKSEL